LVGGALIRRLGTDGQLDPSHDTIAADVGCSARTVRRALGALRQLGLLSWQRRLVRIGWRVLQTSSAYALSVDGTQPYTGGQSGRETRKLSIKPVANQLGQALQRLGSKNALEKALAGLAGAAGLALG
jgi:DNA-binding transcriptional MocR family regulator